MPRDRKRAAQLYYQSARLGCPIAARQSSFVFAENEPSEYGVAPDADLSRLWCRRAAGLNLPSSCFALGCWFWWGTFGFPAKSVGAASLWLKRAVAVGGNSNFATEATKWLNGTADRNFHAALQQLSAAALEEQEQVLGSFQNLYPINDNKQPI